MTVDIPHYPSRMTRLEAKDMKERRKAFEGGLKAAVKGTALRIAAGSIFIDKNQWFFNYVPNLAWGGGAVVDHWAKPMALDPIFWSIVDLEENGRLPLSFRSHGAWVLRPPARTCYLSPQVVDPVQLATDTVEWIQGNVTEAAPSAEALLAEIRTSLVTQGAFAATEICLHLIDGDLDAARAVIHREQEASRGGGFGMSHSDGAEDSFCDMAARWIRCRSQ